MSIHCQSPNPQGPYHKHQMAPPHIYQRQRWQKHHHRLAAHRHTLTQITPIPCQPSYQPVDEQGTRVLYGTTEVSGRSTISPPIHPSRMSIECQSGANPSPIHWRSGANPVSIRYQSSANLKPIHCQSKAEWLSIPTAWASIHCQSGANPVPIHCQFSANPA